MRVDSRTTFIEVSSRRADRISNLGEAIRLGWCGIEGKRGRFVLMCVQYGRCAWIDIDEEDLVCVHIEKWISITRIVYVLDHIFEVDLLAR